MGVPFPSSLNTCAANLKCTAAISSHAPEPQNHSVPTASSNPPEPSPEPSPSPSPIGSEAEDSGNNNPDIIDDDIWSELDELNNPTPEILQKAQAIANGHAFNDHGGEFPEIETRKEFAQLIDDIMNNPSEVKHLSNGRTAYWDDTSNTLVITDPGDIDGGTVFRPTDGKNYFDRL